MHKGHAVSKTTYAELTDAERQWVQNHPDRLPRFVEAYSPADSGQPISLEILDRAFAAWLGQSVEDKSLIKPTINIVGIHFGQFFVEQAGFRWVVATEQQGTDLAVLALPGKGDVLVYLANFVAKRWERRETDFLARSFAAICEQVEQIAGKQAATPARPWWRF
jgi:hypothetical protein